jgi:hypothetical protein
MEGSVMLNPHELRIQLFRGDWIRPIHDSGDTIGNRCSIVGDYIFIGTNEYIQIIFVGPETDENKAIFVGLGQAPMNI